MSCRVCNGYFTYELRSRSRGNSINRDFYDARIACRNCGDEGARPSPEYLATEAEAARIRANDYEQPRPAARRARRPAARTRMEQASEEYIEAVEASDRVLDAALLFRARSEAMEPVDVDALIEEAVDREEAAAEVMRGRALMSGAPATTSAPVAARPVPTTKTNDAPALDRFQLIELD